MIGGGELPGSWGRSAGSSAARVWLCAARPLARGGARAIETGRVSRRPSRATGVDQAALGAQARASARRPLGMMDPRSCRTALPATPTYGRT